MNHESAFSGYLAANKTEDRILPNFFWQDYARTSLDSAVPVMRAKEQSRRVMLRKYHRVYGIDRFTIQEGSG